MTINCWSVLTLTHSGCRSLWPKTALINAPSHLSESVALPWHVKRFAWASVLFSMTCVPYENTSFVDLHTFKWLTIVPSYFLTASIPVQLLYPFSVGRAHRLKEWIEISCLALVILTTHVFPFKYFILDIAHAIKVHLIRTKRVCHSLRHPLYKYKFCWGKRKYSRALVRWLSLVEDQAYKLF